VDSQLLLEHAPFAQVSQDGQSPSDWHGGAQCPSLLLPVRPGNWTHTSDPEQGEQGVSGITEAPPLELLLALPLLLPLPPLEPPPLEPPLPLPPLELPPLEPLLPLPPLEPPPPELLLDPVVASSPGLPSPMDASLVESPEELPDEAPLPDAPDPEPLLLPVPELPLVDAPLDPLELLLAPPDEPAPLLLEDDAELPLAETAPSPATASAEASALPGVTPPWPPQADEAITTKERTAPRTERAPRMRLWFPQQVRMRCGIDRNRVTV
jgi:hypothetical protein